MAVDGENVASQPMNDEPEARPIPLTTGPAETVLPDVPQAWADALEEARARGDDERDHALRAVAATYPRHLAAGAELAERAAASGADVEAYAFARVGYHRGLDALRAAGWRGSGYVRFRHPSNQGFLRALAALARVAQAIGEHDEADRCSTFLGQLDPELRS